MNVSPAVRTIQDDPIEGETVTLLIESADETDLDTLEVDVEAAGGTVTDRRQFETLAVEVAHEDVGDVCAVGGIDVVETDNAATIDADGAGEDVEYDPGS